MNIDIRTTVELATLLALIVGASLRFALHHYPDTLWPAIRLWVRGVLLLAGGWMLYGLRYSFPDILALGAGSVLLGLGFAKLLESVRAFTARPDNALLIYVPVAAIALSEVAFTYLYPSVRMRAIGTTAIVSFQLSCMTVVLLTSPRPARSSYLLTAGSSATLALVLALRVVHDALSGQALTPAVDPSPIQTLAFGLTSIFPAVASLGFVSMCNERINKELHYFATVDLLTGVSNRRALFDQSAAMISAARDGLHGLALLMLDADNFKAINDRFGHKAGDETLRLLAGILRKLHPGDVIGRLGGDEFVILVPVMSEANAEECAESLRATVEKTDFRVFGETVSLRVSVGVALFRDGDDFDTLLNRADQAMYAAKRAA